MSAEWTAAEALGRARSATVALGLDDLATVAGDLTAFAAAPPTVRVAGPPHSGRGMLAAAIHAAAPRAVIADAELGDEPPAWPLWDALVVTTPADQAYGHREEAEVTAALDWGCPVVVVVTYAGRLPLPAARAAGEAEIERYRLAPALADRNVRWWIAPDPAAAEAPAAHLVALLEDGHERAVRAGLRRLGAAGLDRLGPRVRERDRERERLSEADARLPLVGAHLAQQVKLAELAVDDAIRRHQRTLYEAIDGMTRAVLGWLGGSGHGDWADVEEPLRSGWRAFGADLDAVLPAVREQLHAEAHRLEGPTGRAEADLGAPAGAPVVFDGPWDDYETRTARAAIDRIDLDGLFREVAAIAHRAARRRQEDDEREDSGPERNRAKAVARRIQDNARQAIGGDVEERIPLHLGQGLDGLLTAKLRVFLAAAVAAAGAGARRDSQAVGEALAWRIETLRRLLADRYAWGAGYRDLVTLATWSGEDGPR